MPKQMDSRSSYLLFGEKSSLRTVLSCFSVVIGYIAGVDGEINFSLRGTLFGVGASAVGTLYTIYLKRYLSGVVDNSYLLSFYTNFNSCLILPFLSLLISVSFSGSLSVRVIDRFHFSWYYRSLRGHHNLHPDSVH